MVKEKRKWLKHQLGVVNPNYESIGYLVQGKLETS